MDLREASGCGLVVVSPGREVVWEGLLRVVVVGTIDFLFLFIQKTFLSENGFLCSQGTSRCN